MHDHHVAHEPAGQPSVTVTRLRVANLYCECCADELERAVRANPHVVDAKVDFLGEAVEVRYHAGMLDEAAIQEIINGSGRCTCGPDGAKQETTHLHHQAQVAPVTMGTKHDRMQYELPASLERTSAPF